MCVCVCFIRRFFFLGLIPTIKDQIQSFYKSGIKMSCEQKKNAVYLFTELFVFNKDFLRMLTFGSITSIALKFSSDLGLAHWRMSVWKKPSTFWQTLHWNVNQTATFGHSVSHKSSNGKRIWSVQKHFVRQNIERNFRRFSICLQRAPHSNKIK